MFFTGFTTAVELMIAFQQVTLFGVGLLVLALAAFILVSGLQIQRNGLRVTATIIGVRKKGDIIYPVYRYTSPETGAEVEVTATSGSSSMNGKNTGTQVPLLVKPGDPQNISSAGPWFMLWSVVVGALGAVLVYFAVSMHPLDKITVAGFALACVYFGFKLHKIILPKGQRGSIADWRAKKAADRAASDANSPLTPIEDLAATPAMMQQQITAKKNARITAPLLTIIGLGMIIGGTYLGQKLDNLEKSGLHAPGRVTAMAASHDADSSSYHAIVGFTDDHQQYHEFRDAVGTSPPSHAVGDDVTVLYDGQDPAKSAVIDRGWKNWIPAAGLGLFGLLLLLAGFSQAKLRRAAEDTN